jgi:predicted hydrocarbon binding protein
MKMTKKTLPAVIPKRLFSLEDVKPGERLYEVCVIMKDVPGALAKTAKVFADAKVNIKAESSFYVPGYDDVCFWTAFLDVSKATEDVNGLREILLQSDVAEDVKFEEPKPAPFEIIHFPALQADSRAIILTIGEFWALMDKLEKILTPSGLTALHYDAGKSIGAHTATLLRQNYKLGGEALIQAFVQSQKASGWAVMDFQDVDFEQRTGKVVVRDCFEATAWGKKNYKVCNWTRGIIAGFMSNVFGKPVEVKETRCMADGDDHCEFNIQSTLK